MARWEYQTLIYGTAERGLRRWVLTAADAAAPSQPVGESEKGRFAGRIWQANRLLETALKQLDAEGWELVSASFSGIFGFYGTAVMRRPASQP